MQICINWLVLLPSKMQTGPVSISPQVKQLQLYFLLLNKAEQPDT